MEFEDNFIDVLGRALVDPQLKLMLQTRIVREVYSFDQANLELTYDPEIGPDRLTEMPSQKDREFYLRFPLTANLVDEPMLIHSEKRMDVAWFSLKWEPATDLLRIRITFYINYVKNYLSKSSVARRDDVPEFLQHDLNNVLIYALRAFVKTDQICDQDLKEKYPELKRIELCINAEMADELFGSDRGQLDEVEPGWFRLASREVA